MYWSFAIINNRLAEIYFERKGRRVKFLGHGYVNASEFKTKTEKQAIAEDTKKVNLSYHNREYHRKN